MPARQPGRETAKRFSQERRAEVAAAYANGERSSSICGRFNISLPTALRMIRQHGVTVRRSGPQMWKIRNPNAFDAVTPESAYWAGFLMADGCIQDKPGRSGIDIHIGARDVEHLHKFLAFVGSDHPVRIRAGSTSRPRPQATPLQVNPMAYVFVPGTHWPSALARFGVVPRKSLVAVASDLVANNRDFWRGCVDGDGWVTIPTHTSRSGRIPTIGLVGSHVLVGQFHSFVTSHVPDLIAKPQLSSGGSISRLLVSGNFAIQLARVLYGNACVAIDRKADNARVVMAMIRRARIGYHAA